MCSPVGHSLVGYTLYLAWNRNYKLIGNWKKIVLYIFAANAPDLDFIPGIFIGDANRFHHGISHTLGFSILFALGMYVISRFKRKKDFIIFFLLYFGHVLIDFLTADTTAPFGVMLFWPFTKRYFIFFHSLFLDIHHFTLSELFDLHNIKAMAWEMIIFFPIIISLIVISKIKKKCFLDI